MSKDSKYVTRGKYEYVKEGKKKDKKKESRKEYEKRQRENDKLVYKKCSCNHIDSKKGKTHFEECENGTMLRCKICGGKVFKDSEILSPENVKTAVDTIYTVYSLARNKLRLKEDTDRAITSALLINERAGLMLDELRKSAEDFKKKKKNKDHHDGKGKKKKKFNRISY